MRESIRYRGPDEEGEYYFDNCALGHVRLSIIDIKNGQQPMLNNRNKTAVVFNGEIYGYRDIIIKEDLTNRVSTSCDTEVLLALYEKYGTDMMKKVPGMFAFAIWDDLNQRLFCARDRFGEKPFYYAFGRNGEFIFASEIKAILATGLVEPVLDKNVLGSYLKRSYVYPTKTIYKNVFALPPAHQLIFDLEGEANISRYWDLPQTNKLITEEEAVEEFTRLFHKAVRNQLVADVPLGAFLSGGLDSGTVVSVASEYKPNLTTISFAFENGVDESKYAEGMAKKYGTNHITLHSGDYNIADLLNKMNVLFDEPLADPATVPAYLISKAARDNVKVVLTGDAGDELLGGYSYAYRTMAYALKYQQSAIPLGLREFLLHVIEHFDYRSMKALEKKGRYDSLTDIRRRDNFLKHNAAKNAKLDLSDIIDFYRNSNRIMDEDMLGKLGILPFDESYFISDQYLPGNQLDNLLRYDIVGYLPGNGFLKTDRTTMAVSLESRTPFCDYELADFCISLPFEYKVKGNIDKYILRKAFSDKWTDEIKHNVKNGFSPPMGEWLKDREIVAMTGDLLRNPNGKVFSVIDYNGAQQVLDGAEGWPKWELLILALWIETHKCYVE